MLVFALIVSCRTPATQIQLFIDTDTPTDRAVTLEIISFSGSVQPRDLQTRANVPGILARTMVHLRHAREWANRGNRTSQGVVRAAPA